MKSLKSLFQLLFMVFIDIIKSNYVLLLHCFRTDAKKIPSGYIVYKNTVEHRPFTRMLLAHLVTITPGSITVSTPSSSEMEVHLLDHRLDNVRDLKEHLNNIEKHMAPLFGLKPC